LAGLYRKYFPSNIGYDITFEPTMENLAAVLYLTEIKGRSNKANVDS
jgi:hypothetical protein